MRRVTGCPSTSGEDHQLTTTFIRRAARARPQPEIGGDIRRHTHAAASVEAGPRRQGPDRR